MKCNHPIVGKMFFKYLRSVGVVLLFYSQICHAISTATKLAFQALMVSRDITSV